MPTRHEAVVAALVQAVSPMTADVLREEELPISCPEAGVANIVPQDPEELDYRLGDNVREWARRVQIEIVVKHSDRLERIARLDAVLVEIGAILHRSTLGGLVDYLNLGPPVDPEVIPMEGAASLIGAVVDVELFYETSDNPMEVQS